MGAYLLEHTTSSTAHYSTSGPPRTWTNIWPDYLLASLKTPNGNTTTLGYDSAGALMFRRSRRTRRGGLPETIVDPDGATTTLGRQRLADQSLQIEWTTCSSFTSSSPDSSGGGGG